MTPFRTLQVIVAAFLLFASTWFVRTTESSGNRTLPMDSSWLLGQEALAGVLAADNGDNDDNSGNGNANSNNNDNNANSNSNNNNSSDGNGNSGDGNFSFDDNDNFDTSVPPAPQQQARPAEQPCSTPGRDSTITSFDGKVSIHVFASMPRSVRFQILQVIDFLSAPLPPGNIVGLLVYEIRASECNGSPIQTLPAEVNLAIRYNDVEAIGLDESRFTIGKLDLGTRTWYPVEKQETNTGSNTVTATINEVGFYSVYEAR